MLYLISHSRINDDCFICDVLFPPDRVSVFWLNLSQEHLEVWTSVMFLKNVAGSLDIPLSLLFRTSYELSTLPTIWKSAIVAPVFKKGSLSSVSISLTCVICKLMESIIKDRLITYLLVNNLISKQQRGFVTKHYLFSIVGMC